MSIGNNTKYYTIGQAAEITGVKQSVIRFWEDQFPELSPRKNKFGHRVFTENDIKVIISIRKKLYDEGLTIKGAKKRIVAGAGKTVPVMSEIRKELEEILAILRSS